MEGFKTFTQCVDMAAESCSRWKSAADGQSFDWRDMMDIAAVLDMDYPLPEEVCYVVFPDGEIGTLSLETNMIHRMFLPENTAAVDRDEILSAQPDESVLALYEDETPAPRRFCRYCGALLEDGSVFCQSCGKKL